MWLSNLKLLDSDKEILLNSTGWLTDAIVDAAQMLLRQQYPSLPGLQNVCCGLVMSYDIQEGEFLHIINSGHGHWLTLSTIGVSHPEVQVYDSKLMLIPPLAKAQIASILCTQMEKIEVSIMNAQLQVRLQ